MSYDYLDMDRAISYYANVSGKTELQADFAPYTHPDFVNPKEIDDSLKELFTDSFLDNITSPYYGALNSKTYIVKDFGEYPDDRCLVAVVDKEIVGAVWTRIMNDYGHIDDETPSLAMSVLKDHRGRGIGAHLLQELISLLIEKGYKRIFTKSYFYRKRNRKTIKKECY